MRIQTARDAAIAHTRFADATSASARFLYALVAHFAATSSFAYLLGFLLDARVPHTVDRGGPTSGPLAAAAVDLALLAAFVVPHSVLARPWSKRAWRRVIPASLDRSTYNLVATATLALLFWQWRPIPSPVWTATGPIATALRGGFWLGWGLCAVSVVSTNLFDLTGMRPAWRALRGRAPDAVPLTRALLYARVRHPLYVGFFWILWSVPDMRAGRLLFALACTAYILVGVRYEERDLRTQHGPAYDAYRADVPRFGLRWPHRASACLATVAAGATLIPLGAARAQPVVAIDSTRADSGAVRRVPSRFEVFPRGTLFPSLTASLKEPQFRQSLLTARSGKPLGTLLGHAEEGGEVSLFRMYHREKAVGGGWVPMVGEHAYDGMEMTIQASAATLFDLAASKWTQLNTDFTFAYPVTWRHGRNAFRFRPFHLSSHLGDRYLLLRPDARTFNKTGFRREAVEILDAYTFGDSARSSLLYGGGEYAYSVTPKDMKRIQLRAGAEHRSTWHEWGTVARGAWVIAAEETAVQDRRWAGGLSVRTGLEVGRLSGEDPGGRRYRALLEYYGGPATYGHFSREDRVRYVGIGCYVIP